MSSLNPEQAQLFPGQAPPAEEKPANRIAKKFLLVTLVVTGVGLLTSIGCAVFVGLGWRSLRNDEGDDGTIDNVLTMTTVSHAAFWITAAAGLSLFVLTLLVYWWISTAEERARKKKRAFKAKDLKRESKRS